MRTARQNAEVYFSADGTRLVLQSTHDPFGCDQIFTMDIDGANVRLSSTGKGRATGGVWAIGEFAPGRPTSSSPTGGERQPLSPS